MSNGMDSGKYKAYLFMEQFIEGKQRELVLKMSSGEIEKNSGN